MGLLDRIFGKRDLSLSDPKAWSPMLWNLWGRQSKTGLTITEHNAVVMSTYYRCVKLISDTIASLPLKLYRKTDKGREEITERKLIKVLNNPNERMSHFRLFNVLQYHLCTWGNCFLLVSRDNMGRVQQLAPLRPDMMEIKRDNGAVVYVYHTDKGAIPIGPKNLLHIPGFGFDGLVGYSLVALAREGLGLGVATEEFGSRFFGQGYHPGIVIKHPGKIRPEAHESLRGNIADQYQGLGKHHLAMLLEEGMEIQQLGIPNDDAQFLETRKFQVVEICRYCGVPPHMAYSLDRATFSNIEHQSLEFVRDSLRPWVTLWEQELARYFLEPNENVFFEFKLEALLRGDTTSRFAAYAQAVNNGWMNRNEVRSLENLNPVDGLDVYTVQLALTDIEKLGDEPEPVPVPFTEEDSEEEDEQRSVYLDDFRTRFIRRRAANRLRIQQSYVALFEDIAKSVVNRETIAIGKSIGREFEKRGREQFEKWLDAYYKDLPEFIQKKYRALLLNYSEQIQKEAAKEVGVGVGLTKALREFIETYLVDYSERYSSKSVLQLKRILDEWDEKDVSEVLEQRLGEWEEKKAKKEAVNETSRVNNAVTRETFIGGGVTFLVWAAVGKSTCPYCLKFDGVRIAIDEPFIGKDEWVKVPNQSPMVMKSNHFHPPLHQGCDCQLTIG